MRDGFGGVTNLVIIVVFLTLVSGYLAFNVNYTKAFRVKNKIISTLEEYEGVCDPGNNSDNCHSAIQTYMNGLGYDAPNLDLTDDEYDCGTESGYCIRKICVSTPADVQQKAYFKVVTQINIDIPIVNRILPGLKIFQVSGDTKIITVPNCS